MTKKETERLQSAIDQEGFDYCFTCYSSWDNIEDQQLHLLINKYVEAQHELEKYIKSEYKRHDMQEL